MGHFGGELIDTSPSAKRLSITGIAATNPILKV
jgi:hypothetical protein